MLTGRLRTYFHGIVEGQSVLALLERRMSAHAAANLLDNLTSPSHADDCIDYEAGDSTFYIASAGGFLMVYSTRYETTTSTITPAPTPA